ncbi:hypothetical protein [Corynebacterium sp. sy039]|uniref:hypothetical protein n=1 Tax=Corynebacterium sp. sy039 TaxID=2599641 RepID=UPI0011B70689|nr:hypothetical protein [Corynebacterium sp. sy039]QDZ42001.1 hypothetical protein FQV43_01570 [Corynebacterium sp. sy039]
MRVLRFSQPQLLTAISLIAGLALSACAGPEKKITDSTWQVTNVYTTADYPSEIADEVAGAVTMTFGGTTVQGFTGCAPFNAIVSFNNDSHNTRPEQAQRLSISDIKFRDTDPQQCQGKVQFFHEAIVEMLTYGKFTISHPQPDIMLLTSTKEPENKLDSPAIKLINTH